MTDIKNKPFTGYEVSALTFITRFPKSKEIDKIVATLKGRAKKVALVFLGKLEDETDKRRWEQAEKRREVRLNK